MTRARRAYCHANFDVGSVGVSIAGSPKWVRQEFPKLVAMARKLSEGGA